MSAKLVLLFLALLAVLRQSTGQYYGGYPTAYGNSIYGGAAGGYGGYGYGYPGSYGDYGYASPSYYPGSYAGYVGKRSSGFEPKTM
ncbi:unnamed protein product [Caenorhabditis sp. 36 PRJEB53466]|nr:unnamed protein product [Caenorhabditis sp. 36 PRJEB53466]